MQPTASAVGASRKMNQPRRGARKSNVMSASSSAATRLMANAAPNPRLSPWAATWRRFAAMFARVQGDVYEV